MKHFTFSQDRPLMKILIPNGLKKLRSEKITYCLVNPILRKVVKWTTRSLETDFFFQKTGIEKVFAHTAKNTVISPNFLVWKFCGKTQFLQSFGRIARNYAETVPVQKIFTPRNLVKLRYFPQCNLYTPIHSFEITLSIIYYFWQYNHPWSSDVVFLQCRQANIIFNILPCGNKKICHFAFRVFW